MVNSLVEAVLLGRLPWVQLSRRQRLSAPPMGAPQGAAPPQGVPVGGPPPGQGGPQMQGGAPDLMSMLQNGGIKFSRCEPPQPISDELSQLRGGTSLNKSCPRNHLNLLNDGSL